MEIPTEATRRAFVAATVVAVLSVGLLFVTRKGGGRDTGADPGANPTAGIELAKRARELIARYHLDEAHPLVEQAARLAPESIEPRLAVAELSLAEEEWTAAAEALIRAASIDARDRRLYPVSGRLRARSGIEDE